ncbi:MAG: KpsF/GutQ family sugar-phosphate isomerase [Azonexus sp.]|jgi:arabinose-5-phosphate isomerase|uniref:KpsF/GutQ family sugar-phosphate isomerase n=1 Tax=Azonexus sp. TaxID=1872668 RepID=UPI002837EE7B|nr:KpsF/GutQ family sugar-phosphate isomerase [Azonexus sp.]MDR0775679.1 KpsF/GutQ family sugar-phosphate isomerase [Azonexus sp.]
MNPSISHPCHAPERALELGRQTLTIEAAAVAALARRLDDAFARAVDLILNSRGRVIVSGMGKSGHVARKIAATLASTGTPAYFVHPAEASHGDLGMIARDDVLLALSNSGESEELLRIVPLIKRQGARLISMTGAPQSTLARQADIHLDAAVDQEACPHNLAPTASTTAALALGDALAVALLDARGFGPEDFARSHPGGSLGRRLLTHVADVMRPAERVPAVAPATDITTAVVAMSRGGLGLVAIVDDENRPLGIFTDGDLRRAFEKRIDLRQGAIASVMHPAPHTITGGRLAVEAVEMMERLRINALLVTGDDGRLAGALNMHDLFTAKVI